MPIIPDDTKGIEDMLREVGEKDTIFLIVNSFGGEATTASRIIRLYRQSTNNFKTIIPDMAKSAATQICLGSDEIYMGRNSELGPIDPLIRMNGAPTPARTLIDSLKNLSSWKKEWGIPSEVLGAMGANLNPATVQRASDASEYIKEKASEEISEGMDLDQEKAKNIVNELTERKAHGEEVTIEEAKKLGIKVKDLRLDKYKELWDKVWEHYLRTTSYIREEFKTPRAKVMGTKKGTLVNVLQTT